MEDSFKEKIRLAKSFNQNTVIRNGKLGRIFENSRIIAPEENCVLTLKLIQTLTITERGGGQSSSKAIVRIPFRSILP